MQCVPLCLDVDPNNLPTQLHLDGTVEVKHPDDTVGNYALEQLTLLYDGIEQLEAAAWTGSDGYHTPEEGFGHEWDMDMDEEYSHFPGQEWGLSTGSEIFQDAYEDEMDSMEVGDAASSPSVNMTVEEKLDVPNIQTEPEPAAKESREPSDVIDPAHSDEIEWNRFDILPSAPSDHAFFSSPHAQPSKSFLGRLSKEYRILRSSLPGEL